MMVITQKVATTATPSRNILMIASNSSSFSASVSTVRRIINSAEHLQRLKLQKKLLLNFRVRQIAFFFFFLENALKRRLNIFSNLFFYLKVQFFWLIMENNFIQMAVSACHAIAYTIGPIFKRIIDCVQLYFTNGFTNIVL